MHNALLTAWKGMRSTLEALGTIITALVLGVFYFTVLGIFAILFRLLADALGEKRSDFVPANPAGPKPSLKDFLEEY